MDNSTNCNRRYPGQTNSFRPRGGYADQAKPSRWQSVNLWSAPSMVATEGLLQITDRETNINVRTLTLRRITVNGYGAAHDVLSWRKTEDRTRDNVGGRILNVTK
jgi:hypothetical protein